MAQKPIEDVKLVVRALFDGSCRETGMGGPQGSIAGGELYVMLPQKKVIINQKNMKPKQRIILYISIFFAVIILFFIYVLSYDVPDTGPNTENNTNKERASKEKEIQPVLEIQSFRCYKEYGYFIIEGAVKNISNKALEDILAVGSAQTEDGEFVKSSDALIEYNPILAGQISPFKVMMTDNPAIKKCNLNFKEFWGGTIPWKDGRNK